MGTLALTIVQRYVESQERDSLQRNAEVVAGQAAAFMDPQVRRLALSQLAFASAFLGDARVKILDADGAVLADSGDPGLPDEFLWLVPSALQELRQEVSPSRDSTVPLIFPLPSFARTGSSVSPRDLIPLMRDLPFGSSFLFARRVLTPWGRSFVFEDVPDERAQAAAGQALPRRYVTTSASIGGTESPLGTVELSGPLSLSGETLRPMRNAVYFSGLGSLVVALAVGLLFGRTISDPLRSLAATAHRMADGDLGARAASGRGDEIGALARQFNAMAESLEKSFRELRAERDSLKRFVADASHELRTPITALATFNELLQGSAARDEAARQEFLRESQAQLTRLQWITTNLLDLSRLDAGIASLTMGLHPAADMVQAAVKGAAALAQKKGVSLAIDSGDPGVRLECDRGRVEMAISNLVTNAVKFVQETGSVTVSVQSAEGRVRFVVGDNGPGIPPEEIPVIFERFTRGNHPENDGAGLGLAIVQSVARAHGGTVGVKSVPGKGSVFTLELPAARST